MREEAGVLTPVRGRARSGSPLDLLSGHLPLSWRAGLDLLWVLPCLT